jgi:hypothetical protein
VPWLAHLWLIAAWLVAIALLATVAMRLHDGLFGIGFAVIVGVPVFLWGRRHERIREERKRR